MPSEKIKILTDWQTYSSTLLNNRNANSCSENCLVPSKDILEIKATEITRVEIDEEINQLKRSKAHRVDYTMTAKVLKDGGKFIVEQLHTICQQVYDKCHAPTQ